MAINLKGNRLAVRCHLATTEVHNLAENFAAIWVEVNLVGAKKFISNVTFLLDAKEGAVAAGVLGKAKDTGKSNGRSPRH